MSENLLEKVTKEISADPAPQYNVARTRPDELLRHDISDEELGMLSDLKRDYLWEGKWVAIGLAVGALPNFITGFLHYFKDRPVEVDEMIQIILFVIGITSFFILHYTMSTRSRTANDLVSAIRERTKHHVTG